jgi:hypothetical protein
MGRGGFGAEFRFSRQAVGSRVERKAFQHQEGNGAGDGERLHGRSKALKGEPQERIRHETRPAGSGRMKASGGRENLKAQAVGNWEARPSKSRCPGWGKRCRGRNLMGGAVFRFVRLRRGRKRSASVVRPSARRASARTYGLRAVREGARLWPVRKRRASARRERPGRSKVEAKSLGSARKLSVWVGRIW